VKSRAALVVIIPIAVIVANVASGAISQVTITSPAVSGSSGVTRVQRITESGKGSPLATP
jgi:hypothetical protein